MAIAKQTLTRGAEVEELTQTRNALAESQGLFQAVFESAGDAILLADDEGRFLQVNPSALKLFGFTLSEFLGKVVADLLPFGMEDWTDLLETNGMDGEFAVRRKDGSKIDVEFRVKTEVAPRVHLLVLRDLTGRNESAQEIAKLYEAARGEIQLREKVEQELKNLNHELEQRIEDRTAALRESHSQLEAFCYSVSHDLRAPLRSMQGFSHALIEDHSGSLNDEGKDFARRILGAAEHMDGLLADVLAYSRLSRQELKPEPVCIADVFEDVRVQLQSEIKGRKAQLDIASSDCAALAHRSVLELMLVNLVDNALKFVPADRTPHVRIELEPHEKKTRIWVRDNGIGIPREHQQRIFRIFERLHGVETYPGTGIGLALVQKAADRMDGAVGVESAPGEGSSFWIELPSAQKTS